MSLFPAYVQKDAVEVELKTSDTSVLIEDLGGTESDESAGVSPTRECSLLASGSDTDAGSPPPAPPAHSAPTGATYYVDRALDRAYYLLSTLYFPSRPQYEPGARRSALGAGAEAGAAAGAAAGRRHERRRDRRRRYFTASAGVAAGDEVAQAEARAATYRRELAAHPDDEALWLKYLDFQERCGSETALASAAAAAAPPGGGGASAELRERAHTALRATLPPAQYLEWIRDDIAKERRWSVRAELWARLVTALAGGAGGAGGGGDLPGAAAAAAAAALADTRQHPRAYPRLLYVLCCVLRSCGLWERLVQLTELVVAMSAPYAAPTTSVAFPPPPAPAELAALAQLEDYEQKVIDSGLPLGEVWSRVERARAAAQWRPGDARSLAADPQRAPLAPDHADLLLPAVDADARLELVAALLRAAEQPLLPGAQHVWRAAGGEAECGWEAGAGVALLTLSRAARRLPPAHPARTPPAPWRALLHHAMPQRAGFDDWVAGLWEAALAAVTGGARDALLAWRLRVLHARLLLLDPQDEAGAGAADARRVRNEAKAALRRHAGGALPLAQWARVQAAAGGGRGALTPAMHALRLALAHPAPHDALYVARVVWELDGGAEAARWALVAAALRRPLPADTAAPPPRHLLEEAATVCQRRCEELERELEMCEGEEDPPPLLGALQPARAEWGSARVLLAAALGAPAPPLTQARWRGAEAARYAEACACALAGAFPRDARVPTLAAAFPHNAYLVLVTTGAPLWRRGAGGGAEGGARSPLGALAGALPPLLRAAAPLATPVDAMAAERACWRALRARGAYGAAGAPALWALLLAWAARAHPDAAHRALLHALQRAPHAYWLYAVGAALCPRESGALPDLLLERQLRLRALPDELMPLSAPASVAQRGT